MVQNSNLLSNQNINDIEAPTIKAIRDTFTRLGFEDKETVVLIILGHQ